MEDTLLLTVLVSTCGRERVNCVAGILICKSCFLTVLCLVQGRIYSRRLLIVVTVDGGASEVPPPTAAAVTAHSVVSPVLRQLLCFVSALNHFSSSSSSRRIFLCLCGSL